MRDFAQTIVLLLFAVTGICCLEDNVSGNVPEKRSWKWEVWDVPSGNRTLNIYVFNITNPDEALQGVKPILEEIGPYVYEEKIERTVQSYTVYSVVYKQTKRYSFVPELSEGSEDDIINTINVPLFAAAETVARSIYPDILKSNLMGDVLSRGQSMILTGVPVADLLFNGYDIGKEFQAIATFVPNFLSHHTARTYSVFGQRNGVTEEMFHVDNGLFSEERFGKIYEFNGRSTIAAWTEAPCNFIRGTDGTVFSSTDILAKTLESFESTICRSIKYTYDGETSFKDIDALRFEYQENLFDDPRQNSDNLCYCTTPGTENSEGCVLQGAMDISTCQTDMIPLTISYPRLYNADEEYTSLFPEIDIPNDRPISYVIVEPVTGIPLEKVQRLQYNLRIRPIESIEAFKYASNTLFPLVWTEERYELDSDSASELLAELTATSKPTTETSSTTLQETTQTEPPSETSPQITDNPITSTTVTGGSESESTEQTAEGSSTVDFDTTTGKGSGSSLVAFSVLVFLSVYLVIVSS